MTERSELGVECPPPAISTRGHEDLELGDTGENGLLQHLPQPLGLRGWRALDLIVKNVCAALLNLNTNNKKNSVFKTCKLLKNI